MIERRGAKWLACITLVCVAIVPGVAGAADAPKDYTNPVLFADYSDPDAIRVGNDYYLVASSFHFSPGLPILKSQDLVHWTIVGHALASLDFDPRYNLPGPVEFNDATERVRFNWGE